MRFLLVASLASLAASCAPRHDVFLTWTIDGFPAAQACHQLADPTVRIQIANQDVEGGELTEETVTTSCADGTPNGAEAKASAETGNIADLLIEVLDGGDVYGSADAFTVNPGAGGHYPGHEAAEAIAADIGLTRGRLRATLLVVGASCSDAGAGEFAVTLRRKSSPLGTEVVVEENVDCPADGDAIFEHQPVELGDIYQVVATTTIGGADYTTEDGGSGAGVQIENGFTDLTVDLDVVGRPD
jgi:hypothetical protein